MVNTICRFLGISSTDSMPKMRAPKPTSQMNYLESIRHAIFGRSHVGKADTADFDFVGNAPRPKLSKEDQKKVDKIRSSRYEKAEPTHSESLFQRIKNAISSVFGLAA